MESFGRVYEKCPTEESGILLLERLRWKGSPVCPYCGSLDSTPLTKEWRHHCNCCNTAFSVTVNTIFHRSHIDLRKWFSALRFLSQRYPKKVSVRELANYIDVRRNTAHSMLIRIKNADGPDRLLLGLLVESIL